MAKMSQSEQESLDCTTVLALSSAASNHHHSAAVKMSSRTERTVVASWNPLLWCLLVLVWLCLGVGGLSSREDCERLFDTPSQRAYVCLEHPDLVTALQIAEKVGRRECQSSFQSERWNCSGFSILKTPNVISTSTKEAAYVHALSLAAIAHSVAKVCALGDASSCTCNEADLVLPQRGSTQYELGCSDNVEFGLHFARNFLLKRRLGSGLLQRVEEHNILAGTYVVQEKMDGTAYTCRCMGVSGSCTLQTCQYELPEFSKLAKRIREIYDDHSCKIVWNGISGPNSALQPAYGDYSDRDLIFMSDSPNYCIRNELFGSVGTVGRECDPHSTGHSSCDYLCRQCGRGHMSVNEVVENNCYCEFVFCCDIRCRTCSNERHYHVCT